MKTLMLVCLASIGLARAEEFHLHRSSDNGQTWLRSDEGLPTRTRINALHLSPKSELAVAATDAGLFISTNAARTWTQSSTFPKSARPIAIAAAIDKLIVSAEGAGIFVSDILATTWHPMNEGLYAKTIRCLHVDDNHVYGGTDRQGLFRLDLAKSTWSDASTGLPENSQILALAQLNGALFAGLYGQGLYMRETNGQPFRKIGDKNPLVLAALDETLVIGLNPGGIYRTTDRGLTFERATFADPLGSLFAAPDSLDAPVWTMIASGKRIFAGAGPLTYVSDDEGKSWRPTALPSNATAVAFASSENLVLAATTLHKPRAQ